MTFLGGLLAAIILEIKKISKKVFTNAYSACIIY